MIHSGNPLVLEPRMIFFPHVMLGDTDTGLAMGLGDTVVVTGGAPEVLTAFSLDIVVC